MKFTFTLLSIFATIAAVAAVNIRAFSSYNCLGRQYICYNIPAGACCRFPAAHSMRWTLPVSTRGIGHAAKYCTRPFPFVYGPRTNSCFNYLGATLYSGKWQKGICLWQVKRALLVEREECAVDEGCIDSNVLIYSDGKTNRTVDIPVGSLDKVEAYLNASDYTSLATLKDVKLTDLDLNPSVDLYDVDADAETLA